MPCKKYCELFLGLLRASPELICQRLRKFHVFSATTCYKPFCSSGSIHHISIGLSRPCVKGKKNNLFPGSHLIRAHWGKRAKTIGKKHRIYASDWSWKGKKGS